MLSPQEGLLGQFFCGPAFGRGTLDGIGPFPLRPRDEERPDGTFGRDGGFQSFQMGHLTGKRDAGPGIHAPLAYVQTSCRFFTERTAPDSEMSTKW